MCVRVCLYVCLCMSSGNADVIDKLKINAVTEFVVKCILPFYHTAYNLIIRYTNLNGFQCILVQRTTYNTAHVAVLNMLITISMHSQSIMIDTCTVYAASIIHLTHWPILHSISLSEETSYRRCENFQFKLNWISILYLPISEFISQLVGIAWLYAMNVVTKFMKLNSNGWPVSVNLGEKFFCSLKYSIM